MFRWPQKNKKVPPVSEPVLCYFSSYLACQHLSPQTVKHTCSSETYADHTRITRAPRVFIPSSSQIGTSGIRRSYRESGKAPKIRLPITPPILQTKTALASKSSDQDIIMLWATATLCFYGFFRAGKITVPSLTAFNDKNHLSWGDNPQSPQVLAIHLKVSKTDQLGKGVDASISRTNTPVCAVAAVLAYMAIRGTAAGPFFIYKNGQLLTKSNLIMILRKPFKKLDYLMRVSQAIASE